MYWARWEIAATKNAIFFAVQLLLLAGALIASAAGVHSVLLHSTAPTPLKVSLCVARVGGRLVTFGAPLLLLTGSKLLWSHFRTTKANRLFPTDKVMPDLHRNIALVVAFGAGLHTLVQVVNYAVFIGSASLPWIPGVWPSGQVPTIQALVTGVLLACVWLVLFVTATLHRKIKSMHWEHFWYSHVTGIVALVVLAIHGTLFGAPYTIYWLAPFALVYLCDVIARRVAMRYRVPAGIVRYGEGIVRLSFERVFEFEAGQYVEVCVPEISRIAFHPFTIASAPQANVVDLFIKTAGAWTSSLYALAESATPDNARTLAVVVRGPFGAPAQDSHTYPLSVYVGIGIGATPFRSLLLNIAYAVLPRRIPRLADMLGDLPATGVSLARNDSYLFALSKPVVPHTEITVRTDQNSVASENDDDDGASTDADSASSDGSSSDEDNVDNDDEDAVTTPTVSNADTDSVRRFTLSTYTTSGPNALIYQQPLRVTSISSAQTPLGVARQRRRHQQSDRTGVSMARSAKRGKKTNASRVIEMCDDDMDRVSSQAGERTWQDPRSDPYDSQHQHSSWLMERLVALSMMFSTVLWALVLFTSMVVCVTVVVIVDLVSHWEYTDLVAVIMSVNLVSLVSMSIVRGTLFWLYGRRYILTLVGAFDAFGLTIEVIELTLELYVLVRQPSNPEKFLIATFVMAIASSVLIIGRSFMVALYDIAHSAPHASNEDGEARQEERGQAASVETRARAACFVWTTQSLDSEEWLRRDLETFELLHHRRIRVHVYVTRPSESERQRILDHQATTGPHHGVVRLHVGRPNWRALYDEWATWAHHRAGLVAHDQADDCLRVGVFVCGPPAVERALVDAHVDYTLTTRSSHKRDVHFAIKAENF